MVQISEFIYKNLAERLLIELDGRSFFNGSVEYDSEELWLSLTMSALVYQEPLQDPSDLSAKDTRLTDIVPVWWECNTFQPHGQTDNDFCWTEFKKYLL